MFNLFKMLAGHMKIWPLICVCVCVCVAVEFVILVVVVISLLLLLAICYVRALYTCDV